MKFEQLWLTRDDLDQYREYAPETAKPEVTKELVLSEIIKTEKSSYRRGLRNGYQKSDAYERPMDEIKEKFSGYRLSVSISIRRSIY